MIAAQLRGIARVFDYHMIFVIVAYFRAIPLGQIECNACLQKICSHIHPTSFDAGLTQCGLVTVESHMSPQILVNISTGSGLLLVDASQYLYLYHICICIDLLSIAPLRNLTPNKEKSIQRPSVWKCRLQSGCHFILASIVNTDMYLFQVGMAWVQLRQYVWYLWRKMETSSQVRITTFFTVTSHILL